MVTHLRAHSQISGSPLLRKLGRTAKQRSSWQGTGALSQIYVPHGLMWKTSPEIIWSPSRPRQRAPHRDKSVSADGIKLKMLRRGVPGHPDEPRKQSTGRGQALAQERRRCGRRLRAVRLPPEAGSRGAGPPQGLGWRSQAGTWVPAQGHPLWARASRAGRECVCLVLRSPWVGLCCSSLGRLAAGASAVLAPGLWPHCLVGGSAPLAPSSWGLQAGWSVLLIQRQAYHWAGGCV